MFPNLELEMFKAKISTKQLAERCGICASAMRNKLNGLTQFTLPEIEAILSTFPTCDWKYLFLRDDKGKAV